MLSFLQCAGKYMHADKHTVSYTVHQYVSEISIWLPRMVKIKQKRDGYKCSIQKDLARNLNYRLKTTNAIP